MSRLFSLFALLSVSFSMQAIGLPCIAQAEFSTNSPSIKTRGDAQINVNPDVFNIIVGVATQDKDLSRAYELNEETGSAVLAVAKKHKLKAEDVSTSQLTVNPDYDVSSLKQIRTDRGIRQIENFHVKRAMSFKFRDSALLEPILKDCITAGANHIERVGFETSELRKHKDAARILALKAAREKAELLAGESGAKVGKILRIDETVYANDSYMSNTNISQRVASEPMAESGGGIAIGQIPIKASIVATFELTQ